MQSTCLSHQTRVWGSLLLATGLVAFGLVWLALVGTGQGAGPRLTGRQAPELVQPFSPQRLVGGLAPDYRDQAVRP